MYIRKSGPDIVGSIENREKIFEYTDLILSLEDKNRDNNISFGNKEDVGVNIAAEVSNSFRPSASSKAASRNCNARADANIMSITKVRKLPRDLLRFA